MNDIDTLKKLVAELERYIAGGGNLPPRTYRFELYETNHGIDGWDAKTVLVARFSSQDKAEQWLATRGFTYRQYGAIYHQDERRRHTMGCISYKIQDALMVPEDPT